MTGLRIWAAVLCLGGILLAGCEHLSFGAKAGDENAGVKVSSDKDGISASAKLELTPIEGTAIQFVANTAEDIFLCDNSWFKFRDGAWTKAVASTGPWVAIAEPPAEFKKIPPGHAKGHVIGNRGAAKDKVKDKDKDDDKDDDSQTQTKSKDKTKGKGKGKGKDKDKD